MIAARAVYEGLLASYGPQRWWPADDLFEIMVGAFLVQRTTWANAAAAIAALKAHRLLSPAALAAAELHSIEQCCRRAGFFRSKAARLKSLAAFLTSERSLQALRRAGTPELRELLLSITGIGPETADAILLYGFGRPAVVVDAYLRRLHQRLLCNLDRADDERLRAWIGSDLTRVSELNEMHALVVAHGKRVCGARPNCGTCSIRRICETGLADISLRTQA